MREPFLFFLTMTEAKEVVFERLVSEGTNVKRFASDLNALPENPNYHELDDIKEQLDESITRLISIRTIFEQMSNEIKGSTPQTKIYSMNK